MYEYGHDYLESDPAATQRSRVDVLQHAITQEALPIAAARGHPIIGDGEPCEAENERSPRNGAEGCERNGRRLLAGSAGLRLAAVDVAVHTRATEGRPRALRTQVPVVLMVALRAAPGTRVRS